MYPYDAKTGEVDAGNGATYVVGADKGLSTVEDPWEWMLTGPVAPRD